MGAVGGRRDRDSREFDEYVATHWPRLVRAAVLLGCTPTEAEDVVQTALVRCLVAWRRVRAADDRDAYGALKTELGTQGLTDVMVYSNLKAAMIYDLYEKAFAADPDHAHEPQPR